MERHGDGACAMSFQYGQRPKLHAQLDRADAECSAGKFAVRVWRPLRFTPHERGQESFAAVGRCTVMYGMYGKNGSGGIPSKYRTLSDIPYTRGLNDLSHRQGISPVSGSPEGTAGTRTLVQSLVCYTHHDGGWEKSRTGGGRSVILNRAEKEERQMTVSSSVGRTFSESRDGDSPFPRPQTRQRRNSNGLYHFTICKTKGRRRQIH